MIKIHNNNHVVNFYETSGQYLIKEENYPKEIQMFLNEESSIIKNQISNNSYSHFVECGCMNARNLGIISYYDNLYYYGIDLVENYIIQAENIIKQNLLEERAAVRCISAELLNVIDIPNTDSNSKILCFFPFNSFGNVANPIKVLNNLQNQSLTIFISTYQNDVKTNKIRYKYYKNCGYLNIIEESDKEKTLFKSNEGLYSNSYTELFFLKNLFPSYKLETFKFSEIGILFKISPPKI